MNTFLGTGLLALVGAASVAAAPAEPETIGFRSERLRYVVPESGAVLQTLATDLTAPTCHIIDSIWASAALDALGLIGEAEGALAVHLATVRTERGVDTPSGSLPREIRTDGRAASFWGNADPESAAWLLAACWRHGTTLPEVERSTYLASIWPKLSLAADYLACEPIVGGALSGALPPGAAPLDVLRTHYLGLESSRRIAELLGMEEPGLWSDRRGEIYARIRFRTLNRTDGEEGDEPWVDWWIAVLPGDHSDAGWAVLKTAEAPVLTDSAITEWLEAGSDSEVPLARRDALRCLMEMLPRGG